MMGWFIGNLRELMILTAELAKNFVQQYLDAKILGATIGEAAAFESMWYQI